MTVEVEVAIWEWLPGRTDNRRVTLPTTISTSLDLPVRDVIAALDRMERAGFVVRDSGHGRQSGWHRGKSPRVVEQVTFPEEQRLF